MTQVNIRESEGLDLRALALSKGKGVSGLGVSKAYAIALMKGRAMPAVEAINKIAIALPASTEEVYAACQVSCRLAQEGAGQAAADVAAHVPGSSEGGAA